MTADEPGAAASDPHVARLARLFGEHPAWLDAARRISDRSTSSVYFRHRPGEAWRLLRRDGRSQLLPGPARDPDFVFRFTPASIEILEGVSGGVGDFAVALFSLLLEDDVERRVDLRIAAPFGRLLRRGYVGLLLYAGPKVAAFGAARGVRTLGELRRVVAEVGARAPAEWEVR